MSTDEQIRDPEMSESPETGDAEPGTSSGVSSAASDGSRAELRDIEAMPLAERAPAYQELANRLRTELEQSDPSRSTS